MPHHRLVSAGRHDSYADEIILSRDEETGEVEHKLSMHSAHEVPEELLQIAHELAGRIGLRVVEAEVPDEEAEADREGEGELQAQQEPGADSTAGSPVVKQTGESTSEIDQQAQQGRAGQQDTASTAASGGQAPTTGGGTPASSATSAPSATGTAGTSGTPSTPSQ